jgi:hypothetical protein
MGIDPQGNPVKFNHWKTPTTDRGGTMPIAELSAYKTENGTIFVQSGGIWSEPRLPEHVHQELLSVIQLWKSDVEELLTTDEFRSIPESWIWAIMWAESRGNPNVKSKCGALGLMQVMPFHFGPTDSPFEPRTNLRAGARWILQGIKRLGGAFDLPKSASHYNAGGPFNNTSWVAAGKNVAFTTKWGVPAEKGYIDTVVCANNTFLSLDKSTHLPLRGDAPDVS